MTGKQQTVKIRKGRHVAYCIRTIVPVARTVLITTAGDPVEVQPYTCIIQFCVVITWVKCYRK